MKTGFVMLAVSCLGGGGLFAQAGGTSTVRINTQPKGLVVIVDGQVVTTPATFIWPLNSKHILQGVSFADALKLPVELRPTSQYSILGWTASNQPVTLDAQGNFIYSAQVPLVDIVASYAVTFRVRVSFFDCSSYLPPPVPGLASECPADVGPGVVFVDSQRITYDTDLYLSASSHTVQAYPNPGWIFTGWYYGNNLNGQPFSGGFTNIGSTNIYPRFVRARKVTVDAVPQGLFVVADRTQVATPQTLEWGEGTSHQLSSIHDQRDNHGKLWVFDSWSDGGAESHDYIVPESRTFGFQPVTVTAKFVPGERVTFQTSPIPLSLTVDGRTNWPGYNFNWGIGTSHTVTAPATQKDSKGRTWNFKGWSNSGAATQTVTVPDASGLGLTLIATYEPEAKLVIESSTPGISIQVDGVDCATPCLLNRDVGVAVRLTALATLPAGDGSRLQFVGWGDSTALDRTITTTSEGAFLNVAYRLQHRLSVSADAPDGVTLTTDPGSSDDYFDASTQVKVTVEVKQGFKLSHWDGDAAGASKQITVEMNSPKNVRAVLERIPAIFARGARNAAADTGLDGVSAGSVLALLGVNLAADYQAGPDQPMTQTLGDVTVRLKDRILPLFFVSPDQINALLPSDVEQGLFKLIVHREGKPETSTDVTVVRNAPALFNTQVDGQAYAMAVRENGEAVTVEKPAMRGETVTVFGTGFGPYLKNPPDGFLLPESDNFRLADPLALRINDEAVETQYAGGAVGRSGVQAVRFKVGAAVSGSATVKVRINELDSNSVLLPVEQ